MMGSNYLSVISIGGRGSFMIHRGSARFAVKFTNLASPFLSKYLIISIPTAPTTMAVVVAMAGIILPAMIFTLKLSTSYIP